VVRKQVRKKNPRHHRHLGRFHHGKRSSPPPRIGRAVSWLSGRTADDPSDAGRQAVGGLAASSDPEVRFGFAVRDERASRPKVRYHQGVP
jgi:hypothetical protein